MMMRERLAEVLQTIARYKTVPQVRLVAVTKYASLEQMHQLFALGVRDFGENKVQDALEKMSALPPDLVSSVSWHLIGPLQSNKVNKAVGRFDWIHSVDSLALAEKISRQAQQLDLRQKILLQVNLTGETQKSGFTEAELQVVFASIVALPNLDVRGLMTIARAHDTDEALQATFERLRTLRGTLAENQHPTQDEKAEQSYGSEEFTFSELSMGMSQDYGHALKSGATIIRIGQYLLT